MVRHWPKRSYAAHNYSGLSRCLPGYKWCTQWDHLMFVWMLYVLMSLFLIKFIASILLPWSTHLLPDDFPPWMQFSICIQHQDADEHTHLRILSCGCVFNIHCSHLWAHVTLMNSTRVGYQFHLSVSYILGPLPWSSVYYLRNWLSNDIVILWKLYWTCTQICLQL